MVGGSGECDEAGDAPFVHRVRTLADLARNLLQQVGQLRLPHVQAQLEQLLLLDPADVDGDNCLQIA